ncbi:MBL fold metallo-hydrolase [Rhodococcus qingshengii]|uniref:MBL fold metallo-hydrolase n=1 Tax=Rhodococcus qingshengii TaxID=334542 RepID=UPI001BEB55AA|nr:MBL fold metallo-hydrolase [Rhodococcus qingshengii]MBT2275904.1 MBL fold metallo-hydrolase [Rhodococcus qingshengii]
MTVTLDVFTSAARTLPNGGTFSPTTSTLVLGTTEAVLIDTQYSADDVDEVIRRIDTSGRTLTAVFVTHAHPDHYFGLERLLRRFPRTEALASTAVAEEIKRNLEGDRVRWAEYHAGAALDNTVVPDALIGSSLHVDGAVLEIVEIPQADISPASIVHIPAISAVIAGDAIYNGVNPFLGACAPADWPKWIESVDLIAGLDPEIVVAGHKRPELGDTPHAIAETRRFLELFIQGVAELETPRDLVASMHDAFPDFENSSALAFSAVTAFKRKKSQNA